MTDTPQWTPGQPSEKPYADAAWVYRSAGWEGVLPLPAGQKEPPETGWTGHAAPYPSGADIQAWVEDNPGGNISLRMPPDVIGLDVDCWGGKPGAQTLAAKTADWGELPPTWTSTSRTDGSGIRFYRVPPGVNWVGSLPGIEIIQAGHRYAVVEPSIHPEGRTYRWFAPDGAAAGRPPHVDELPVLPAAWVVGLARTYSRVDPADLDDEQVIEWITQLRGGEPCQLVTSALLAVLGKLADSTAGGRHDLARDALYNLLCYGGEGHAGVTEAVHRLQTAFLTAATDTARGGARARREAVGEWRRMLVDGIRKAATGNPTPQQTCDCLSSEELHDLAGDTAAQDGPVPPPPARARPRIDITIESAAVNVLIEEIRGGALPNTYVRHGQLVEVEPVSGTRLAGGRDPFAIRVIDADSLRRLLAAHASCYRIKATKESRIEVPALPTVSVAKAVLRTGNWSGLDVLTNLVTAPVLRPDGSLLQDPGYDQATGLFYDPAGGPPRVPDQPNELEIRRAKKLVLDRVLGDFPWAGDTDLANYVALLMTPILRPHIGGLSPLGAVSATERGSGKTLLTEVLGRLYGAVSRPWVSADDELRKAITAILTGTEPVVVFDNVGDHDAVAAPSLAKLLTSETWNDRILGTNNQAQQVNDRCWLVTGNSIEFGGDIAQRTVLVRLDPKCARPDLRTGFAIPDLGEWLEHPQNRIDLLYALLVLARSWIVAGAPRQQLVMRGFTRWARGLGGFLAHHGIGGFLTNAAELEEHDEEATQWAAFLAAWHLKFGREPQTAYELLRSARTTWPDFVDPWEGAFITRADGSLPTPKGLGMMLARRRGRFFGDYVLAGKYDSDRKVWSWRVEPNIRLQEEPTA